MIGFTSSKMPDETWDSEINGRTYRFTKSSEREGLFLYKCQFGVGNNSPYRSFYSERDLNHDEVERLPQFDDVAGL